MGRENNEVDRDTSRMRPGGKSGADASKSWERRTPARPAVAIGTGSRAGARRSQVRFRRARPGVVAARGAVDPGRGTVDVVLLFPDRQPRLGFVDDVAAGVKRVAPVFRRHADPHRELAQRKVPHAVHGRDSEQGKTRPRLGQDPRALGFCEHRVRLVFERLHGLPVVAVSHPTLEGDTRPGAYVRQLALQRGGVDRLGGDAESVHAHKSKLPSPLNLPPPAE
jgi:hypothetical protein